MTEWARIRPREVFMFSGEDAIATQPEDFCNRWRKQVFAFCRMFLGEDPSAEEAACRVLATFYYTKRNQGRQSAPDVEAQLMGMALRVMNESRNHGRHNPGQTGGLPLDDALQMLPPLERAVLIMRNLLHMDWPFIALAADVSDERAHRLWAHSIIRISNLRRNATLFDIRFPKGATR